MINIELPTLHGDQTRAYKLREDARGGEWDQNSGGRYKVIRCGRRWGKTVLGETWICDGAVKGEPCGWFAPSYKYIAEAYEEIYDIVRPLKRASSKTEGVIRLKGGGRIDFWTLEDERAGRSRKYKRTFIDEAAFTKPNMLDIWKKSIKPTLLDLSGRCLVGSNTNGVNEDNFLYQICHDPSHGFIEYHAPSINNPNMPAREPGEDESVYQLRRLKEFEDLRSREHPLVYAQEYMADFIDWSGVAFFSRDKLLVNGEGVDYPSRCDAVFAVVDSATKTGTDNDGTAVTWYAYNRFTGHSLIILDWDIVQIEGALLESWLPSVFSIGEELARSTGSRAGFAGVFIEDKASGEILLQQARRRNLNVHAIESRLTALGKDERALSVSGYVYTEKVKVSKHAYDKVTTFKGTSRNHFMAQVTGFRLADKDEAKRADDLLDTFCYGVALSLGDNGGF